MELNEVEELREELNKEKEKAKRYLAIIKSLSNFVFSDNPSEALGNELIKSGIKNVVIYGWGYVGRTLYYELAKTEIKVLYGIDQKCKYIIDDIEIVNLSEVANREIPDAIIVTPVHSFRKIEKDILEVMDCKILSIDDIWDQCYEKKVNLEEIWEED